MAVSQEVAAAVQGDTAQRLNAQLQVFGAVQWLAAGNLTATEIFTRLERLSGYALYACTMQRTQLLDGVPVPPPECADLIPSSRTSPPTVPGGYVLPVTGPRGTAGYLLAMEKTDSVPAGESAVQHIATVAALQLSMLAHEREMMWRQGAETLAEMLQGVLDKALVAKRLAAQGFALDRGLMLAIVRPRHEAADDDSAVDVLAASGQPYLILRQQDELCVLVHDNDSASAAVTGALDAAVGLSRPFPAGASLAVARREARWALARAVDAGRDVVRYGDDRTDRWLTDDSADLRALVEQVLGGFVVDVVVGALRMCHELDLGRDLPGSGLTIRPADLLLTKLQIVHIEEKDLLDAVALLTDLPTDGTAGAAGAAGPPGPPAPRPRSTSAVSPPRSRAIGASTTPWS